VEGTSVRRGNGDKIGTIEHVMLDKRSGRIERLLPMARAASFSRTDKSRSG
jgi:sporulation protein YlmC with PRC-barrel domain